MSEKGYREINRRVFAGERRRPLRPEELADRRPILVTGKLPEELLAMRRHQSIFIAGRVPSSLRSPSRGWNALSTTLTRLGGA